MRGGKCGRALFCFFFDKEEEEEALPHTVQDHNEMEVLSEKRQSKRIHENKKAKPRGSSATPAERERDQRASAKGETRDVGKAWSKKRIKDTLLSKTTLM